MNNTGIKTIPNELFFEHVMSLLEEGKAVKFALRGESMRPFLKQNDLITVKPIREVSLKKGHIVLAQWNAKFVLHRIIRLEQKKIYLAGDGNLSQIEEVSENDVIAFLSEVTRDGRSIDLYSKSALFYASVWLRLRFFRKVWHKLFGSKIYKR
ncbi:S24 family peptidase [Sphingobacterium corticis]|uniref:S24 family peptidase n=1 Tax=Sphingobacterium corticis TaxID=1812823 RepID=A0ABW5NGN5_9SPHI